MQIETWPLVLIEWDDAESEGDDWQSFEVSDIKKAEDFILQKCVSVGWLVRESKDIIWVIPHLCLRNEKDPSYSRFGGVLIPKAQVTKRITLVDVETLKNLQIPVDNTNKTE